MNPHSPPNKTFFLSSKMKMKNKYISSKSSEDYASFDVSAFPFTYVIISKKKKIIIKQSFNRKRETRNLSTNADTSTDTLGGGVYYYLFFSRFC